MSKEFALLCLHASLLPVVCASVHVISLEREKEEVGVSVIASLLPKSIGLLRVRLRMCTVDRWQKEKALDGGTFVRDKEVVCL